MIKRLIWLDYCNHMIGLITMQKYCMVISVSHRFMTWLNSVIHYEYLIYSKSPCLHLSFRDLSMSITNCHTVLDFLGLSHIGSFHSFLFSYILIHKCLKWEMYNCDINHIGQHWAINKHKHIFFKLKYSLFSLILFKDFPNW